MRTVDPETGISGHGTDDGLHPIPKRWAATDENTASSATPKPNTEESPVVMNRRVPAGFGISGSGPRIARELIRTATPRS